MYNRSRASKSSGLSTIAIAVVAVVVIAGLGGAIFFVLPSLSSDDPTQASTPSAPSQPSTPVAPSEPPPVPEQPEARVLGDPETCNGFLSIEEVMSATGHEGIVFEAAADRETPGRDPNLAAICNGGFSTPDGLKAVSMTIMTLVSDDAALTRMDAVAGSMSANPAVEFNPGILGENTFQTINNNEGVGSMVVIQSGSYIMIFVALPEGENALASPELLVDLVRIAMGRLPN